MNAKKLFYVPGLISLVGLPLLLLIVQPEDPVYKTALKLNMPAVNTANHPYAFTEAGVDSFLKTKNIEEINLNPLVNEYFEMYLFNRKREFLIHEIERLQFTNDTNRVLKIKFGEENTYQDFMYVLNLAKIYQFDRYIFMDDAFYLVGNPPPREPYISEMTFPVDNLDVTPYQSPTTWDYFKWNMEEKWHMLLFEIKQSPRTSISFLILILIPAITNIFWRKNIFRRIKLHF